MQKLAKNTLLCLMGILLISSCSSQKKEQEDDLDKNVPELVFGDDSKLSFDDFVSRAEDMYQKSQFEDLALYIKDHEKKFQNPKEIKTIKLLHGMDLIGKKKFKESENFLKSLNNDPDKDIKGKSYFYLGDVKRSQQQYKAALNNYQKAYSILKNGEIFSSIADTYRDIGKFTQAIPYYKKAIVYNPQSTLDRYYLAVLYYQQGLFSLSEKNLKNLLEIEPKFPSAYHYLALVAQKRGQKSQYFYYLSRESLLKMKYTDVINLLETQDLSYTNLKLFKILVISHVRLGQLEDAKNVLLKGLKISPSFLKDVEIQLYKGVLLIAPKGDKIGETYFKKLYKKYPKNFNTIVSYADFLSKLNKKDTRVEKLFKEALLIEPDNTAYRYKLASFYEEAKQTKKAQLQFGILYYYQQQEDQSLSTLTHMVDIYPQFKNSDLFYYIGLIYQNQGKKKLALENYKKAFALNKKDKKIQRALKQIKK